MAQTTKTASKTAAKKAAPAKTAPAKAGDTSTAPGQGSVTDPVQNTGAQTGAETPPESETAGTRPPQATLDRSGATPLEAPDAAGQVEPVLGHNQSSTNHVAANAAARTTPGEDHVRLVGEDGKDLDADSVFDAQEGPNTFVTVNTRVYEEFLYRNSSRTSRRLLFPKGARVALGEAERFKAAHKAHAEQSA
jgi:hypothetical protein